MTTQPPEREGANPPGGPQSPAGPQSPSSPQSPGTAGGPQSPSAPPGSPSPAPGGPQTPGAAPAGSPQSPGGPQSPGTPQSPAAPAYTGPTPPGGWQQQTLAPSTGALADWGTRLGATLMDFVLFFIVAFVLNLIISAAFGFGSLAANSEGLATAGGILSLLAAFAVYAAYTGVLMTRSGRLNGQTLGKQVLGIRVVRTDGQPMTLGTVAVRHWLMKYIVFGYLAAITLYLATLLNYLWPLWDRENRALHDMVASTRVVRA